MRKDFGAKAVLYPMPVFIIGTFDEGGKANAMNAAWGGIADDKRISICLSGEHKTVKNILKNKGFTVSMGTVKMIEACDYVGIVSGNNEEKKFEKAGFSFTKSEKVNAPIINELPLSLECNLISYDMENSLLIGEIVNVSCDESALTDGNIDCAKIDPITYDPVNHKYIRLGEVVGDAFKIGMSLK